jgi:uncharacterized protein YjgD (DUF1641 family)
MATPIPLDLPPRDPREELRARLERASDEHAEALLAALALLQDLHDKGVLDLARAATASSGDVLDALAEGANSPEGVRAIRNLLLCCRVLGRIDPGRFQALLDPMPEGIALAAAERTEPPSVRRLLRRAFSRDALRGLEAVVDILETIGRHLAARRGKGH